MEDLKILQIVGYKNAGKTTLLSSIIASLAKQNIEAAVIKHHGHGGPLEQPNEQTDSMKYVAAGAVSSLAFDSGMLQLHMKLDDQHLQRAIELVKLSTPQIIFIEGMKAAHYPKLVFIRNMDDWASLQSLSQIVAVITQEEVVIEGVPTMQRDQIQEINHFVKRWMDGDIDEAI